MRNTVTILGINGHVGHAAAVAFAEAGWTVRGMGRSNRHPIPGVEFVKGDAESVEDMKAAIGESEVVFDGLNLPYHQWDHGRMEGQKARVIAALGRAGKTLLFPGNIYNYAASARVVAPETPQVPHTARGAIRVRTEKLLRDAAARGDCRVVVLRAGDFFGPGSSFDWFDQLILREASKGRLAQVSAPGIGHSWAYLPDLGRAIVKLAEIRDTLGAFENFHFAGHWATGAELVAAIEKAAPVKLKVLPPPVTLLRLMGLANPIMREIVKMRYLWENEMELVDPRLDAILGPDFRTPFDEAVAASVEPFFSVGSKAAA